jgi:hypothetical protein
MFKVLRKGSSLSGNVFKQLGKNNIAFHISQYSIVDVLTSDAPFDWPRIIIGTQTPCSM